MKHSTLAALCAEIYNNNHKSWDRFVVVNGVCLALVNLSDALVIVGRGTDCTLDDLRDFDAVPYNDPKLGTVHHGFFEGVDDALAALAILMPSKPLILTGHSEGAAHIWIVAARLLSIGTHIDQIVTFGSPRPGYASLACLFGQTSCTSYRNGTDPVTYVAPDPYVPCAPYVQLHCVPPAGPFDLLGWHHIDGYRNALLELGK